MRRTLWFVLSVCAIAVPRVGVAAEEQTYTRPNNTVIKECTAYCLDISLQHRAAPAAQFTPPPGAEQATVTVSDDTGLAVYAFVVDKDGGVIGTTCSSADGNAVLTSSIRVPTTTAAAATLGVYVFAGIVTCEEGPVASPATSGTVSATFA